MPPTSRSSKACTECRQVKLRCDSNLKFPDACTRCQSRALNCNYEASFKRKPARAQLQRLTEQLNQLQSALSLTKDQSNPGSVQTPHHPGFAFQASSQSSEQHTERTPTPKSSDLDPESYFQLGAGEDKMTSVTFRLGSFQLPYQQIHELFSHFVQHQYKHIPILDTRESFSDMYTNTPFLFWTVVVVAIRSSTAADDLLDPISPLYNKYLGQVLVKSPLSLSSIQALLLICLWPLSVENQAGDPSWNLYNIAMAACLRLGTPTRILQQRNNSGQESKLHIRTWLYCLQVGIFLGLHQPWPPAPQASEDFAIVGAALNLARLSVDTSVQLKILCRIAYYTRILCADKDLHANDSIVQLFEMELGGLANDMDDGWSAESEFVFHLAKFNLYTRVVLFINRKNHCDDCHPPPRSDNQSVDLWLLKASQSALKLIAVYTQMESSRHPESGLPGASPHQSQAPAATHWCLPKHYHISFASATFFLIRFVLPSPRVSEHDRDLARNHIRIAHESYMRHSRRPKDEAERAAKVIELLCRRDSPARSGTLPSSDRSVTPDDNGGMDQEDFSMIGDALRRAAHLRGRAPPQGQPAPEVANYKSEDDDEGSVKGPDAFVDNVGGAHVGPDELLKPAQTSSDWQYAEGWLASFFDAPGEMSDLDSGLNFSLNLWPEDGGGLFFPVDQH